MPRWVDLSAHGLALKVRKQDDLRWLVLEAQPGAGAVPEAEALRLGFQLHQGIYQREQTKITLSEVQQVFPRAVTREFEPAELLAEAPASASAGEPANATAPARSIPWWETSVADRYAAIYLVGASRSRESLTLEPAEAGYHAQVAQAGVQRSRSGTLPQILEWLRTDVLVGMGDAFAGRGGLAPEEVFARLRLVKGSDLLRSAHAPSLEVVAAPALIVPSGRWRGVLDGMALRGSIPVNKVAWLKIDADRWTDGTQILDTAALATLAERGSDVLEGHATRVSAVAGGDDAPGSMMSAAKVATYTRSRFLQEANAAHDGRRWHVTLEGQPLALSEATQQLSVRRRPETILRDVHEEQVRSVLHGCTSLATLVSYPALAFPGPTARGRTAEINVMRLLGQLDITERLLEGESGHCVLTNDPYMDLVIERHGYGPGPELLYLTHYFNQGGDRVLDAEMVFAIERGRLRLKETATISMRGGELRSLDRTFANFFSRNLLQQGFGEAVVNWPARAEGQFMRENEEPKTTLTPY